MAVQFLQVAKSNLFTSDANGPGTMWFAILLPSGVAAPDKPILLDAALNDGTLKTTILCATSAPDVSTPDAMTAFTNAIEAITAGLFSGRAILFLNTVDPAQISAQTAVVLGLNGSSGAITVSKGASIYLSSTGSSTNNYFGISVSAGSGVTVPMPACDQLLFTGAQYPSVNLIGLTSTQFAPPLDNSATLSLTGPSAGAFALSVQISRSALKDALNWGFQGLIPNLNAQQPTINYLAAWFPLAGYDGTTGTDMLGFNCQVNPLNPNNLLAGTLTKLFFTGVTSGSQTKTSLDSYYRTNAGKHVTLIPNVDTSQSQQPAALVVTQGYQATHTQNGFSLAPDGDFILTVDGAAANETATMICGLSATETMSFLPAVAGGYAGYRLRFKSLQPANAPVFPLVSYSPVSAPIDPNAKLLDTTFVTSWASLLPPPSDQNTGFYAAAPKGADLFAHGSSGALTASGAVLPPTSPGVALSPTIVMPLYPFAGFVSGSGDRDLTTQQLDNLERQILSPTRRAVISASPHAFSAHAHHALGIAAGLSAMAAGPCPFNATTPAGFISRVACDGTWDQLLLAQVSAPGSAAVSLQMGFTKLTSQLQSAFQTNNMFLVVANAKYLGAPASGTFMAPGAPAPSDTNQFYNTISIGDWGFHAAVGEANQYGDYRNVMIVKGVKGKLVDLVVSPDKWTMKETFAAPTTTSSGPDPDVSQLVPLSAWISDYFKAALSRLDNPKDAPYFQNFCQLIQRDDWTGVLMLRVDIAHVPSDLAGITAGVNDPNDFYAHHIGIEISQIDGATVQQKDASSLFGLVYYIDPAYDDSQAAHPIAPKDATQPYDFTLLTLKALFANSALQKFDSLAEMVLNDIFGAAVQGMLNGNIYNAVLLQGAFQKHGDTAVYSLSSNATNTYLLANNVLTAVEIDSAVMSTRDDGSTSGKVISWIAMGGFMNFAILTDTSETKTPLPAFDLFSFGTADGTPAARSGLNFSNLGLEISFMKQVSSVTNTPSLHSTRMRRGLLAENVDDPAPPLVQMVETEIAFNTSSSTPRALGLFSNFQLELQGLQSGDGDTTPQSLGYLTVGTQYGLQGAGGKAWHGLRFNLNMGTPGELAGKINLTSTLLLSWSDTSGDAGKAFEAAVGLALPGTSSGGSISSLQSVLKLSIGVVQLYYNDKAKSFLLLLNQIALKFLGLLKIPPNGATAFFLFGNPDPSASASTGLGWYAIYNQEVESPKKMAALSGNDDEPVLASLSDGKGEA